MIGHKVEKDLYALFVGFRHECLIILNRTEMRIDGVQIYRSITVVILSRAILQYRCKPQSGHAQVF